jgi:hypothetical protein
MSDAPVTEKRLLEILSQMFDKRFEAIDARFEVIDSRFDKVFSELGKINVKIDQLQRYQTTESTAIEFDLKMILQTYLEKKYPRMTVGPFPMKSITDLSNNLITELDAAFLVSTNLPAINRSLLREKGFPPDIITSNVIPTTSVLVIAEAKHNINTDKIATKLYQFDKIKSVIHMLKDVSNQQNPIIANIITRNKYLLTISEFNFFFGAAFWQERLVRELESAIKKHKKLCNDFKVASGDTKIAIYKQICKLQKIWYKNNPTPCDATISESLILQLTEIESSLNQVELIVPSGDRYIVLQVGGRRTRTRKAM